MTEIHLSFKDWPYPTKRPRIRCCSLGECGFLAISIGSSVSIYSNEIGHFSPMFMWSPFEHDVTAMGWYNGSCTPSVVRPIIAIASTKGTIAIYDMKNRTVICKFRLKGEIINTIVWNPFYRSRFYVGTQSGRLIACQIVDQKEERSQAPEKDSADAKSKNKVRIQVDLKFSFPINFISIDPQTGTTLAVASHSGNKFSVVNNILTAKNTDQNEVYLFPGKNEKIVSLSFFPGQVSFLLIATDNKLILFSVTQRTAIPFITTDNIRFISMQSDGIIIGSNNSVSLWKFQNGGQQSPNINTEESQSNITGWSKTSQITFNSMQSKIPEASLYTELENKIVIITESNWITEIEERRNKLFITQRVRLMPAKPLDWDFRKGSIAFCTSNGQVLATSWTPDSIIQPSSPFNQSQITDNNGFITRKDLSLPTVYGNDASVQKGDRIEQNEIEEKRRKWQLEKINNQIKEQTYRNQRIFDNGFGPKAHNNAQNKTEDNNDRPTFSMLMDEGDDEVGFDVDADQFEPRNNLDFSTTFVSMQANHLIKAHLNNQRQSLKGLKTKLTGIRSTDSSDGHIDTEKLNEMMKSPLSAVDDNSSMFTSVNDDKISLKLPVEVSLDDNNNQNSYKLYYNDSNVSNTSNEDESSSELSQTKNEMITATSACGNSSKLLLSFKVSDHPINHVMWAPGGRLLVWSFYNEQNILQLVDFKRRQVIPLLKVQLHAIHVPITNLFLSKDRSMFCVLIGNQTAVFMTTSSHPTHIGTLNFKHQVIGSFDPTGTKAVFIRKDGYIYIASINYDEKIIVVSQKCQAKYLYHDKKGEPTYVIWRSIGILIGTSLGYVILINGEKYCNYQPICNIPDCGIQFISPITNTSFLILDNKQNAFIATKDGDLNCLKRFIKNIKPASDNTFLCRIAGTGKLTVLSSNGAFTPLAPPSVSRCPLMLSEERYLNQLMSLKLSTPEQAIKACRLFGSIFIMRLIQCKINPRELFDQTNLLFEIISSSQDFNPVAIRLALKLGNNEMAKKLLLETPPNDPNYLYNMDRVALFDVKEIGDAVISVVENLYANGKAGDADEILLTIGAYDYLTRKYLDMKKPRTAALLLRVRKEIYQDSSRNSDRESYEKKRKLAYDVATQLIAKKYLLLGLMILTENDYNEKVNMIVSGIFGNEMTHLLSFLHDADDNSTK